ncbi:hypothetical protein CALVIDRAFT_568971 [Calocera viscosa TUFC12733]|uniref:Uncharacterized protein n=1 Tax=Calocera viscosa (strain TUFC12733) TaxID=1330018 RepID=A0A167GH08_CALVF|nr:hypothetical protein CALVIDRAFT_568971 [Calocera viscosa TUFC12733]
MSTAIEDTQDTHVSRSFLVCTIVEFDGLPPRSRFQSLAKYVIKFSINGQDAWESGEIPTKGTEIRWNVPEDKQIFEARPLATLRVVLHKNRSDQTVEVVDTAELSFSEWLAMNAIPLVPSSTSSRTSASHILVTLFLAQAGVGVNDAPDPWVELMEEVKWSVKGLERVPSVHPYAKMALNVLVGANEAVHAQERRDDELLDLVEIMKDVHAFIRQVREQATFTLDPGRERLRDKALRRLTSQTAECVHFIITCTKDKSFAERFAHQSVSGTDDTIKKYKNSFTTLKCDFRDGTAIRLEIVTFRMADNIDNILPPPSSTCRPRLPHGADGEGSITVLIAPPVLHLRTG